MKEHKHNEEVSKELVVKDGGEFDIWIKKTVLIITTMKSKGARKTSVSIIRQAISLARLRKPFYFGGKLKVSTPEMSDNLS